MQILSTSRTIVAAVTLLLFALCAALYLINPATYLSVMRLWHPDPLPVPFVDTAYIVAQLNCWRAGVDVYVSNPCDLLGRPHAYSPLWLRLSFLPGSAQATIPLALLLVMSFIASLMALPEVTRKRDILLLLAAVASPATAFAIERGNADLLMFCLAAIAVLGAQHRFPGRLVGYTGIMLATLLKFYPVTMFVLVLREKTRVALPLGLAVLGILTFFGWLWHQELARMLPNLPQIPYQGAGIGGRKLPEGLLVIAIWAGKHAGLASSLPASVGGTAIMALFGVLLLAAVFLAAGIAHDGKFLGAFHTLTPREETCLTVGAALYCGCFVAGISIPYREILLLFAVPPLLCFSHRRELGWPIRSMAWVTIFLLWSTVPGRLLDMTFGHVWGDGGPIPTFAFWVLIEALWWWLFVVLAAGLICSTASALAVIGPRRNDRTVTVRSFSAIVSRRLR